MTIQILHGDCVEVMKTLPDCSVDAVVTDPPYGIRFMGQAWDGADIEQRASDRRNCPSKYLNAGPNGGHNSIAAEAGKYDLSPVAMLAFQEFSEVWAREALRVLKPGGHLLSFSSPRTFHRMVCGIEAAGFEIRDQIMWVFGSGFPKSHNGEWGGTALKPAHEPITVARKPLVGTVEANWREHGTGALNIDGCRVLVDGEERSPNTGRGALMRRFVNEPARERAEVAPPHELGRWPANLIHDGSDEALAAFPDAPGQIANASSSSSRNVQNIYGAMTRGNGRDTEPSGDAREDTGFRMKPGARRTDAGSAARFFYCAKATASDRNDGLDGLDGRVTDDGREVPADNAYQRGKSLRLCGITCGKTHDEA